MGASNRESKNYKFYGLKAKVDATNDPYFALQEKGSDGKWTNTNKYNTISGNIIAASLEEKEFNGVKENVFVLILDDDTETMKVTMTHNNITHGIINALANEPNKMMPYEISVTKKQSNNKWYGNGWVNRKLSEAKGENVKWLIDPKSAPRSTQVMVNGQPFKQNGKDVYDHTEPRKFWEQFFKDKIVSYFGEPKKRDAQPAAAGAPAPNDLPTEDSDLPF